MPTVFGTLRWQTIPRTLLKAYTMKLTAKAVQAARYQGKVTKLFDGGGLYLHITKSSRIWRYKFRLAGIERVYTIGSAEDVTLAQARDRHRDARALVAKQCDPVNSRRDEAERLRQASIERERQGVTTGDVIEQWLKAAGPDWAESNRCKVVLRLKHLPETLRTRPVATLKPEHIAEALEDIQERSSVDIARRLHGYLRHALDMAITREQIEVNPAVHPRVKLKKRLAKKPLAHTTNPRVFADILQAVHHYSGERTVQIALNLLPILFCRPGELRGMRWAEIDLDNALWTIPPERMKASREHRVPLPRQAIALLRVQQQHTGHLDLVFPGVLSSQRPMSENTLNTALRRLGFGKEVITSHGFRHTASSMLNEREFIVAGKPKHFRPDVIEAQLSHVKHDVRAAYNRAEYMAERREMMQTWAEYLDELRGSSIA